MDAFAPPVKPRGGGISALAAAASEAALQPAKGRERVEAKLSQKGTRDATHAAH